MKDGAPPPLPSGTVTVVFTDIEGYTRLESECGASLQAVLDQHNALMRRHCVENGGVEVRVVGDAFFLAFDQPSKAVAFAVQAQRALLGQDWKVGSEPISLKVRMGMHCGEARTVRHPTGQLDFFGTAVNIAARIMSAAHGGQILCSEAVRTLSHSLSGENIHFFDWGQHRLKGVGVERLWGLEADGLPAPDSFPPLATLEPEHSLPLPLTPLVGRQEWVESTVRLLRRSDTRLVTLTGFGGMGKTRLALQVAEECVNDFADGVWWVALENATTAEEMTMRIAQQLRVALQPQPTVREQLWNFHRDRQLLLVLDNLEQIGAEASGVILGLLNAAPRLKVLATSRRSLEIAAERLVELPPLSPQEAQNLFVERASARKASFALDPSNTAAVQAICRKVDGMPLGIEIAASLVVLMSPTQILKRLDDQLKLLVARDPSLPQRHQSLRAAVEFSYQLLSPNAREVFACLSVFVDAFDLDAAEEVAGISPETSAPNNGGQLDVYAALFELQSHSLLQVESGEDGNCYSMLVSVRACAREKLRESPQQSQVLAAHALYFCRRLEDHVSHLRTASESQALQKGEKDFGNARCALDWCQAQKSSIGLPLSLALSQLLELRGHWEEALTVVKSGQNLLATHEAGTQTRVVRHQEAVMYSRSASLKHGLGDLEGAQRDVDTALETACALNDDTLIADTLNLGAVVANERGELETALEWGLEALKVWPADESMGRAKTLHNLGTIAAESGESETARTYYEESLKLRHRLGDLRGEAKTLNNLGTLACQTDDFNSARAYYERNVSISHQLQEPFSLAIGLFNLAFVANQQNDSRHALLFLIHSQRLFDELKSPYTRQAEREIEELESRLGDNFEPMRREVETLAWEPLVGIAL